MNKLWYKKQAKLWREALPVGNGKTGVMVYGGKRRETLDFNDVTLWSGYPKDQTNPQSLEYLPKVRRLVFDGKNSEAQKITEEKLKGGFSEAYMPLGSMSISFDDSSFHGYTREIDLDTAVHTCTFAGEERTCFASHRDNCVVYHIASENQLCITVSASSKLHGTCEIEDGTLILSGRAPDYAAPSYLGKMRKAVTYDDGMGMAFCLACRAETDGEVSINNGSLIIKNAKDITLIITTRTGFRGFDQMPVTDIKTVVQRTKKAINAISLGYVELLARHKKDYSAVYARQSFSIDTEDVAIPTDKLVKHAQSGKVEPALIELFYNYGKYLMIAGSRKGGQPLNLQGIWNRKVRPPWSSNYTININTEMNYWATTSSNMGDCIEPFVNMVYELMLAGRKTARVNYGCSGGCCNHNTDIWRKTTPVDGNACFMFEPLCGAWMVNEVYKHYKNGVLNAYKDKVYTSVRESAMFINDYLVMHNGYYVIAPSTSPEASFKTAGGNVAVDYASMIDMCIVRQTFADYLEIEPDTALAADIRKKLPKLYPITVGKTGILEWSEDYEIFEQGHRHFSPLYGFYPANVIKYYANPEEREWVRKLFYNRTENWKQYIGWSAAWAICLAGRLHEGERASEIVDNMLGHSVFANLFDTHPPFLFQIDGNFGFVAGINELLCYTEDGVTELLPALPQKWSSGEMKNIVVNGAQLSFRWMNGKVVSVSADKPVIIMKKNLADSCAVGKNVNIVDA